MTPLEKIYWLRAALGIAAAFLCAVYGILVPGAISNTEFPLNTFLNSLSIALALYLISFYMIKNMFILKVEKPQKLATMGIGIYFFTWLVFWIFLYTIIAGAP
jgi:drug/metabolite transporter (DMT)-like permease